MPYKEVFVNNPRLLFRTIKWKGKPYRITIYQAYDEDEVRNGVMRFWYTQCHDRNDGLFDVRELDVVKNPIPSIDRNAVLAGDLDAIKQAIRVAIDLGQITPEEW